jgi:hypothetical protein
MQNNNAAREPIRCGWAKGEQYIRYHDEEWGVPVHDDRTLFEFLILEGASGGLELEHDPQQARELSPNVEDNPRIVVCASDESREAGKWRRLPCKAPQHCRSAVEHR